jgi:hypothetical protein
MGNKANAVVTEWRRAVVSVIARVTADYNGMDANESKELLSLHTGSRFQLWYYCGTLDMILGCAQQRVLRLDLKAASTTTGCSTIIDHFFITHFSYECFCRFLTSNSDLESWDHSLSAYRFTFLKKHRKTQKTGREKTAYYLMFF